MLFRFVTIQGSVYNKPCVTNMIISHVSSVGESENTIFQLHHVNANAEVIAFCVDEAGTHLLHKSGWRFSWQSILAPMSSTCSLVGTCLVNVVFETLA